MDPITLLLIAASVAVVLGLILELTGKSGVIPLVVAMVFLIGAFLVR